MKKAALKDLIVIASLMKMHYHLFYSSLAYLYGAVCNWLSIFSCMRGTPKIQHQIHPGRPGHFDAVIVWKGKGD